MSPLRPLPHKTAESLGAIVQVGPSSRSVAGMLSRPGQACWKLNRHLPSHWKDGQDSAESVYWMDPAVAAPFDHVRTELGA